MNLPENKKETSKTQKQRAEQKSGNVFIFLFNRCFLVITAYYSVIYHKERFCSDNAGIPFVTSTAETFFLCGEIISIYDDLGSGLVHVVVLNSALNRCH